MPIELSEELRKYVELTGDGEAIAAFVCPVEGCGYRTGLGPGALRMHMLMSGDPEAPTRYDEAHGLYLKEHGRLELKTDVPLLAALPRAK